MSYNMVIQDAENITHLTMKDDTFVKRGDLLGYNSGWVKADADAGANIYAQWVALEDGGDGQVIQVCKKCTFHDEDAPYAANTAQYLSGTAGGITETRPATDNDLIQVVGRSLDIAQVRIEIDSPKEFELFFSPDNLDTSSEPGLGVADAGWPGPQLTSTETCYFKGNLPCGLIGTILEASMIVDSVNASAVDIDVTVVMGHVGASNVEDTGAAITAGDLEQADADNKIHSLDISDCFDTGFYKPGTVFAVYVDPDGISGAMNIIGLRIRGWKV